MVDNTYQSLKLKSTVLVSTNFINFSKIDEILGKIQENVNKNNGNPSIIHKTSSLEITPCKIRKSKKN